MAMGLGLFEDSVQVCTPDDIFSDISQDKSLIVFYPHKNLWNMYASKMGNNGEGYLLDLAKIMHIEFDDLYDMLNKRQLVGTFLTDTVDDARSLLAVLKNERYSSWMYSGFYQDGVLIEENIPEE